MLNETSPNRWYELLRVTRSWRLEWNLEQLLIRVAREAVEFLAFDRGVVFLLGPQGVVRRAVWLKEGAPPFDEAPGDIQKIAEKVVQSGRPMFAHVVGNGTTNGHNGGAAEKLVAGARIGDAYCVPLTAGRGILGALYIDAHGALQRDKQNQEVLEMLGLQAAASLEHAMLYHSAITDPLTGLFSHRHFQQEVEQAVRRALRSDQKLSLLILDLDHFKALNDSEGHDVGNQCLIEVAGLLRSTLRSADIIARFGGDEFELLLPDTTLADAMTVADKIRIKIGKLRFGKNRHVAGTLGVAAFPDNAADGQQLFLRADEALYKAKQAGRNCAVASTAVGQRNSANATHTTKPDGVLEAMHSDRRSAAAPTPTAPVIPERAATEQIDGYTLVRRLGMGSMGEVLLVRQEELEREVALKRPLTPHLTAAQVQAFEREAKITASLNHPGVITVFTLGRDSDGRRYYTMKPLNGMSLAEVLERRRKEELLITRQYTLNRLLEIIQRVAETIAYAHQRSIFHLDLTPANVVLGEFGEVTVIDWGTSASNASGAAINYHLRDRAGVDNKLTFLVGSAGSLAPEQLPGSKRRPNAATDVHALGALLYQVLTGRGPYDRDNTHDVLDAILDGAILRPEKVAPRAGIDPTLSTLCMNALHKDARQRPSAQEFAHLLGRYVRRETDFTITRFGSGPGETPLDLKDWTIARGQWKVVDGELVTTGGGGTWHIGWNTAVPGSFRFVVEGWVEKRGELALSGRNRAGCDANLGYLFQFGAEWNTCTKLSNYAAIAGRFPQPGRRYRLELEYQEGWVYCFIDGEKVFEHRELFHFPGSVIGLYTCDPGVHFKVLEVQRQNWGLNVPASRMADAYFHSKQFDRAAEMYQELYERLGDRLEGLEARLKLGLCYEQLDRKADAQKVLQTLRGTALEPFGLAHEALLEFREKCPENKPRQGIKLFKKMLHDFPGCDARYSVVHASFNYVHAKTFAEQVRLQMEVCGLASISLPHPTMMEIGCAVGQSRHASLLGQYKQALSTLLAFKTRLLPSQCHIGGLDSGIQTLALACGREDLLVADVFDNEYWDYYLPGWNTISAFEVAARQQKLKPFIARLSAEPTRFERSWGYSDAALGLSHLALGNTARALRVVQQHFARSPGGAGPGAVCLLHGLIDAQCRSELQDLLPLLRKYTGDIEHALPGLLARDAIENRDFDAAARIVGAVPVEHRDPALLIFRIMLGSLGLLKYSSREMKGWIHVRLSGTPADLAGMFAGTVRPVPGKLWPHPQWLSQWRLWLALWLEERGKFKDAHAIVKPARDPRLGPVNAQKAIEALLKRTARRAGHQGR